MKWSFNLSYSSYSLYKTSQLHFYFEKIIKGVPDTETFQVYGNLGNIVHKIAETYLLNHSGGVVDFSSLFEKLWKKYDIDNLKTLNNHKIRKQEWMNHAKITLMFAENIATTHGKENIEVEKHFEFIDEDNLTIKGYIDVFVSDKNGDIYIYDYKTNTSYEYESHKIQRLFYSWLCFKVLKKIPKECIWFYCKGGTTHKDSFGIEDIKDFDKEIQNFKNEIISKGDDINLYDVGDIDSPFNKHKRKCFSEVMKRKNSKPLNLVIKNNIIYFEDLDKDLAKLIDKKYSYFVEGHEWSDKFQGGIWDGKKHLFKKDKLPLGFLNNFKEFIRDFNKRFDKNYVLNIKDERIIFDKLNIDFIKSEKSLRDYQEDSIFKILDKKIGIINLATGLGKTFVASEVVKLINKKTLFVVNRIDLADQTKAVFEKELGVEIGLITEGNFDSKLISVAGVQTLNALYKNKQTKERLRTFLYNISCVVYDECHGVNESKYYLMLRKLLLNAEYIIGLSATPFRSDNSTLEMNSFVGYPIVNYDTKYGEDNGYLCKTKTYFIKNKLPLEKTETYPEIYSELITYNVERNMLIKNICDKFNNKKILILTKIIEHGKTLKNLIEGSHLINSQVVKKQRKDSMKWFKEGKGGVLIAGIKIAGQGLNIEDLDVIIIACAHRSAVDSVQTIGRVKRIFPGKEFGYLIDFEDIGYFHKASNERKQVLKLQGNIVEVVDKLENIY